jgi:hypothetical protein
MTQLRRLCGVVDRYGGISKEFIGVIIKKYNRIGLISACRVDTCVKNSLEYKIQI